jgi:hypothetical protein
MKLFLCSLVILFALPVQHNRCYGDIVFSTNESTFPIDRTLDVSNLAPINEWFWDPAVVKSGELEGTFLTPFRRFIRTRQTDYWTGNFGPGEELLYAGQGYAPITLTLNRSVQGIGFQIQISEYGGFTANLAGYNGNVLLGSQTFSGVSTNLGDDSALFISVMSDTTNITRIEFSAIGNKSFSPYFAINSPVIYGVAVPEPSSALAMFVAAACYPTWKRLKKSKRYIEHD